MPPVKARGGIQKATVRKAPTGKALAAAGVGAVPATAPAAAATEFKVDIGKKKLVTVRQFNKVNLVDIREFYEKDGVMLPGKKGISLTEESWGLLLQNIQGIDRALKDLSGPVAAVAPQTPAVSAPSKSLELSEDAPLGSLVTPKVEESDELVL